MKGKAFTGKNYQQILFYLHKYKFRMAILFALILGGLLLNLVVPQIIRRYIDDMNNNKEAQVLIASAMAMIAIVILRVILNIITSYAGEQLGWLTSNKLREDLARHCLELDVDFHKQHTKGELIERIDGDVSFLSNFLSTYFVNILSSVLILIGIVVILFCENILLGAATLIPAIFICLVLVQYNKKATPKWVKAREVSSRLYGFIEEHLSGKEDIKSTGASEYVVTGLEKILTKYLQIFRNASLTTNLSIVLVNSLYFIGNGIGMAAAIFLYLNHKISFGVVYLVFNYLSILYGPWQQLRQQLTSLQQINASVSRIGELFAVKSKIKAGDRDFKPSSIAVTFRGVSFTYETSQPVLDNISFTIEKGHRLGILGRTGSGKTSLVQLLTRFYDAQAGTIFLNDTDIQSINNVDLRREILMITQNVQIFHASVKDNIALFNDTFTESQVLHAVQNLGLQDWLITLPAGLGTSIGPGLVSTGEAQLIAFARAYLHDPHLIILDEATAHLDPFTEQLVEKAFNKLLENKTTIIIAHRLKTLKQVDEILILEKGKMREYGRRADLEQGWESLYAELLKNEAHEVLS